MADEPQDRNQSENEQTQKPAMPADKKRHLLFALGFFLLSPWYIKDGWITPLKDYWTAKFNQLLAVMAMAYAIYRAIRGYTWKEPPADDQTPPADEGGSAEQ